MKRLSLPLFSLVAIITLLFYPFLQPGVAYSDDILVTIYRVFALRQSWDVGILYPRIAPDLAFGYGVPLFQYYPPLSAYLAAFFTLIGVGTVDAVKLTFAGTLLWGGLGIFFYARSWFKSNAAAWLAAVVFMAAPYQLADVYVRGATAEALGLALLPWILWSSRQLFRTVRPHVWFAWLSLWLTLLLISHNALSLFFLPILCVVSLLEVQQGMPSKRLQWFGLAILLALASSAFFWLPALVERNQVNIDAMSAGYYDPLNHLKSLGEVIQQSLIFQYQRPQVYSFGWLPLLLSLFAALLLIIRQPKQRLWSLFALLLIGVPLLLQLPSAEPFWRTLPLVRFIQFPWRLFAFVTLAVAMLIGTLPLLFQNSNKRQWIMAIGVGVVVITYGFANLPTQYGAELASGAFGNENVNHRDLYERGKLGFELFSDYQPTTVQAAMNEIPNPLSTDAPNPAPNTENTKLPTLQLQRYSGMTLRTSVQSGTESTLSLHRFFLPGWYATVDGQSIPVEPYSTLGLSAVKLPVGNHELTMSFGDTPIRRLATVLSQLGFSVWIMVLTWNGGNRTGQKKRRRFAIVAGIVALLALQSVPLLSAAWTNAMPASQVQPLQAKVGNFDLLGYSLDQSSYRPGDTIRLTLYWRTDQTATTEYKVFVHLRDMSDTQMASQHDGVPAYGFTPTTRWLPGELIDDVHPLPIDSAVAPGTYQLAVGMYDPNTVTNLPVQAAKTLPGERIVLGTVEIK